VTLVSLATAVTLVSLATAVTLVSLATADLDCRVSLAIVAK